MPEPEGGEQKYMILGLGLINCKNQESWLVVLRGGCHEPTFPFRDTRFFGFDGSFSEVIFAVFVAGVMLSVDCCISSPPSFTAFLRVVLFFGASSFAGSAACSAVFLRAVLFFTAGTSAFVSLTADSAVFLLFSFDAASADRMSAFFVLGINKPGEFSPFPFRLKTADEYIYFIRV